MVDGGSRAEAVLSVVSLDHPHARRLEGQHLADMRERYGGRGPGPVPSAEFDPPEGCFVVALVDGAPVACGGLRHLGPGVAEIKRMYVDPGVRRRGLGRRILAFLEQRAAATAYTEVWLETGTGQPEAIALYEAAGYRRRDPYGEFKHDPRSRCYGRDLGG